MARGPVKDGSGCSGASLGGNKCALARPSVLLSERSWRRESARSRKLAEGVPASGWLGRGLGPLTKEKGPRVLSSRPRGPAQLWKACRTPKSRLAAQRRDSALLAQDGAASLMRAGKRAGSPWVMRGDYSPGEHAATQLYGFFSVSNQAQENPCVSQTSGPR